MDQIIEAKIEHHPLGRIAFEAYNAAGVNAGKTFDGRPVPAWDALSDDVRAKWQAGTAALFERLKRTARVACPDPADLVEVDELDSLCDTLIAEGLPTLPEIETLEKALEDEQLEAHARHPMPCTLSKGCALMEHDGPCREKPWPAGSNQEKESKP